MLYSNKSWCFFLASSPTLILQIRPQELKGFLPLPPYAAEASWESYAGNRSPGLSCPDWTSDAVGTREGCECVTVSLTLRPLKNNDVSESQLMCQMEFLVLWLCLGKSQHQPSHPVSRQAWKLYCWGRVQLSVIWASSFMISFPWAFFSSWSLLSAASS